MKLTAENMTMHIYTAGIAGSGNENSLCILLDTENCDILITGDRDGFGERMLLRRTALQDVDILVAGHHGAKDSTGEELLSAVQPEIVCISVGAENRFGHPAQETLKRFADIGSTVYRTNLHGNILIRR
jgi:competence protein ComEC